MAHTEILLLKPVEGLGAEGDQVKVRSGYARNFLLPQKIALPITHSNAKHIEALKKRRVDREAKELGSAQELASRLEKSNLAIAVKTGEGGKLFGAVTSSDLHAKLVASGIEIEKKRIHLAAPVKTLGRHTATVKVHAEVSVELGFDVVSENPIIPVAPEKPEEDDDDDDKPRRPSKKRKTSDKK